MRALDLALSSPAQFWRGGTSAAACAAAAGEQDPEGANSLPRGKLCHSLDESRPLAGLAACMGHRDKRGVDIQAH